MKPTRRQLEADVVALESQLDDIAWIIEFSEADAEGVIDEIEDVLHPGLRRNSAARSKERGKPRKCRTFERKTHSL